MKEVRETEVREYRFEDNGAIPNNPTLPLLVYPQALSESDLDPSRCKDLLAENSWGGAWVDGVFPYHHYHSTSHEVLCVVGGSASITFGGPQGGDHRGLGRRRRRDTGRGRTLQRGLRRRVLRHRRLPQRTGKLRHAHRRRGRAPRGTREHPERRPPTVRSAPRRGRTFAPALGRVTPVELCVGTGRVDRQSLIRLSVVSGCGRGRCRRGPWPWRRRCGATGPLRSPFRRT
jgi:hypothetical protein